MASPSIEASSSGLKLSYLRFVSDSAPGFVVLLLLAFILPRDPTPWWEKHHEYQVLFAALLLMLATPVGLVINAVSYFLLGHLQTEINRICFLSRRWPLRDTRRSLMVNETTAHFGFTPSDWAERTDVYGELVESYRPDLAFRIEHLRGLKRFSRAVAFLSLIYFFCLKPEWLPASALAIIVVHWSCSNWSATGKEIQDSSPAGACELWIVIVVVVLALIVSAINITLTCGNVDVALVQICTLSIVLLGLLVAGMTEFYQRASIAMHVHLECPRTAGKDLTEIRDALCESAKRLRP